MDTNWIDLPIGHPEYVVGCMKFIEFAKVALVEGQILCPCKKCKVEKWFPIKEVEGHILFKGFFKTYKNWFFHGNGNVRERIFLNSGGSTSEGSVENVSGLLGRDDMEGLLESTFGVVAPTHNMDFDGLESVDYVEESSENVTHDLTVTQDVKFKKLFEFSNIALYDGCTSFSKLSYLLHLFHLKCMKHWCIESFNMNLKLQLDAFPQMMEFPQNYYECTQQIKDLGLGYEKIHACPNDCCLYWGEFSEKSECYVCGTSRWKMIEGRDGSFTCRIGIPAKVMRYFPLIPRLKRMYMSIKIAEDMIWHEKRHWEKEDDGKLRHPADGLAWKRFDERYEEFSSDPRSVRLGLASDGFNPYRLMNSTYSTWPVVLIPYNLPPWLCMKQSSFILSMIIPGKSSPGNDIDVYLQPLVHELKLLWSGVDAYDAYTRNGFKLRAALLWTINDFPAYAMLSGLSTKGYKACPYCTHLTPCYRFGGRICYVGHRKWLPMNHPYRFQRERFDGYEERGEAPIRPTGTEILREQEKVSYVYGKAKNGANKKRKRKSKQIENEGDEDGDNDVHVFGTKRSIFFDLEYWEHNLLRHNLDVMHIEKNVCDNILGTLLNMEKSRDDAKGREALEQLGIKKDLWLERNSKGELLMPNASYSMNQNEILETLACSSKSQVDIENSVFDELMYGGKSPKRPLNHGFGVKKSDIYGVQSSVGHGRRDHVNMSATKIANLEAKLKSVSEENETLSSKVDETNQNLKMIASNMTEILRAIRDGKASCAMLDDAEATLNMFNNQDFDSSTNKWLYHDQARL